MEGDQKPAFDLKSFLIAGAGGKSSRTPEITFSSRWAIRQTDLLYSNRQGEDHRPIGAGKEAVVALLGAADFCGERCLAGEASE